MNSHGISHQVFKLSLWVVILWNGSVGDHLCGQSEQDKKAGDNTSIDLVTPEQFRKRPLDLKVPELADEEPAAGKRVRYQLSKYKGTNVFHTIYLPTDYGKVASQKYPVIFEYAGNGPYKNKFDDRCSGLVEDCKMGYGLSGGKHFVWVCLPFVSKERDKNQRQWWGDADATVEYCKLAVKQVIQDFQGDKERLFLCGFSRGSIACNYIGLRDDEIATLWCGMICHSHYDGVRKWHYADSDSQSAIQRLKRLGDTPQWISQERSTKQTSEFLKSTGVQGNFRFHDMPFANHSDLWLLQDTAERRAVREWMDQVMKPKSGSKDIAR